MINNVAKVFQNEKYIAFYDSEFNAYDYKATYPQEVVSIGICFVNSNFEIVDKYYSTISLKAAKSITKRCKKITGLTNKDFVNAKHFNKVIEDINEKLYYYKIKKIFTFGKDDKNELLNTSKLYRIDSKVNNVARRMKDIHSLYVEITDGKVSDQSLQFLLDLCNIGREVKHNALSDAVDLCEVTEILLLKGINIKRYNLLMKEREEQRYYRKSRNILTQTIVAPPKILKARNQIIDFLLKNDIKNLNNGIKKAIIDDLSMLFISEE